MFQRSQLQWSLRTIKHDAELALYQNDTHRKKTTSIEQVVCMKIAVNRSPTRRYTYTYIGYNIMHIALYVAIRVDH